MLKRIVCFWICFLLLLPGCICYADTIPKEFWNYADAYDRALQGEVSEEIIRLGKKILDVVEKATPNPTILKIRMGKYRDMGKEYLRLNQVDQALFYYEKFLDTYRQNKGSLSEWKHQAEMFENMFTSEMKLYTTGGTPIYYGAVNEKKNGVLYGITSDSVSHDVIPQTSMILLYQEFGNPLLGHAVGIMKKASESGKAVQFALNCPEEWKDISNFEAKKGYLKEISELFSEYSNVPVYLRFAGEFNTWDNPVSAEWFIGVFRTVSQYFKERNKNVAIVWCPTPVSNEKVDTDAYYPGDAYVDWVGISCYARPYYEGDIHNDEWNAFLYRCGRNASPIRAIEKIVRTYGDRKPIMISESGAAHTVTVGKNLQSATYNVNTTEFAIQRLREYLSYIPMVYPQVKLMAYFDQHVKSEENNYSLSANAQLKEEYMQYTSSGVYIQNSYHGSTGRCYQVLYNGLSLQSVFQVSCYAYMYNEKISKVNYYIDGTYAASATKLPYTAYIDAGNYSGTHTLKAVAYTAGGKTLQHEYKVKFPNASADISVFVDGSNVTFDRDPVIYNDRTLVPMRKIFESLGATVSWNEKTRTATGVKKGRTVSVTIDSKVMYVNGEKITLDTSPILLDDRTLVPARAVAEGLGCEVEWNAARAAVLIVQKKYDWSAWSPDIPDEVYNNKERYLIETKTEYRYREEEIIESYSERDDATLLREEIEEGEWSEWREKEYKETSRRKVEVWHINEPIRYRYSHYCTGKIDDEALSYETSMFKFHKKASYHELDLQTNLLPESEEKKDAYVCYENGEPVTCENGAHLWFLESTEGGQRTMYRYKTIERKYIYSVWGEWSSYQDSPPDEREFENRYTIQERTMYRYKEIEQ